MDQDDAAPDSPDMDGWPVLDEGADVTDGDSEALDVDELGEGEAETVVSDDDDALMFLVLQEAQRTAQLAQLGYQQGDPFEAPSFMSPEQAKELGLRPQGADPSPTQPGADYGDPSWSSQSDFVAPPAEGEPAFPPQPGAPYGADENGIPYLPPNDPSAYVPPWQQPKEPSRLDLMRAMRGQRIQIPPGPESYDGQWRIMSIFLAPEPAEYGVNGYILETSLAEGALPAWRLVTEDTSGSDTPEAAATGPTSTTRYNSDYDFFHALGISGPPVAIARPPLYVRVGAAARFTSTNAAPPSSTGKAAPVKLTPQGRAPSRAAPMRPQPLRPGAAPGLPVVKRPIGPKIPPGIKRAPLTKVTTTPGLSRARVLLPSGRGAVKLIPRPLPRGGKVKTSPNPYDGRWHARATEKPPTSPRRDSRLVERSTPRGALWRFIPRLRGRSAVRPNAVPSKVRAGFRAGRVSGVMDPHADREHIHGNPAGSTYGLKDASPMMVPLSFLTDAQRSRQPAIIGGCACMQSSELDEGQRARVGDFWGDFSRGFSTVDHVVDQVWQPIKGVVPYGEQIDALHRARMDLMYGNEGAGAGTGAADRAIESAQDLTRRSRKGDKQADAQLRAIKDAAAGGDPNARRTWHVIVVVSRDDDARIAQGYASAMPPDSVRRAARSTTGRASSSFVDTVRRSVRR